MIKKCVVCGSEFKCYNKKRSGGYYQKSKRRSNAKTCSKECSKIYERKKHKEFLEQYRKRPEVREKAKKYAQEYYKIPKNKKKRQDYQKEYSQKKKELKNIKIEMKGGPNQK